MKSVRRKMKKGIAFSRRLGAVLLAFAVMFVSWTADGFSIRALAADDGVVCGDFTVYGDTANYSYDPDVGGGQLIIYNGDITIVGTGNVTENCIFVNCGSNDVHITLNNVNIDTSSVSGDGTEMGGKTAFCIKNGTAGNVTLTLEGSNTLRSHSVRAGLQKDSGPESGKLIINGDGSLNAYGGEDGAGIGAGGGCSSYNIIIESGTIYAEGGAGGAGIGATMGIGDITIKGGNVTAVSGEDFCFSSAAAIGGGRGGAGEVTITGGTVTAISKGNGAAIGSGEISDADVHMAIIENNSVTITGGTVIAKSEGDGAAIGGGSGFFLSDVTISGGEITAECSGNGAAIGSGKIIDMANADMMMLEDRLAYRGKTVDDIGDGNVTITGGTITAKAQFGAGIGGGQGAEGNVIINGGEIVSAVSAYGAGIGGGNGGDGNVTITDGTITLAHSDDGAGIGGGQDGTAAVTVINGEVTASSVNGPAIGGGVGTEDSASNTVSITGGSVSYQSGDWLVTVTADGVIIAGYTGSDTEVVIPDTIDGVAVTAIGENAFQGMTGITSVTVPDTVTSIGAGAFDGCVNLKNPPTVGGNDPVEPSVTAYATKEQLMDDTFAPGADGTATNYGKLVFGKNSEGDLQEWYILGKDGGVNGDNTVIFTASPMASGECFSSITSVKAYSDEWGCKYTDGAMAPEMAPEKVYASHYGASDLRMTLQNMASDVSYFTEAEQSMMNATTVYTYDAKNKRYYTTTDKLYALHGDYNSVNDNDKYLWVGTNSIRNDDIDSSINNGIVLAMDSYWAGGETVEYFWLRSPYNNMSNYALVAVPGRYVNYYPLYYIQNVRPASNLNLSKALFASAATSAATAASSDTVSSGIIADGAAMTLRLDGSDREIGTVTYNDTTGDIKATKESATNAVSLVVQGNDGTNDWYYSKQITGTKTINASEITSALGLSEDIDLSVCKIWLETTETDDRMTYAVNATEVAISNISSVAITDIETPVVNTTLDTSASCATTGVSSTTPQITWTPSDTTAGYNTSYTASITLTADTFYEFANTVTATVLGNTATSVKKNEDETLTVTYRFPATSKRKITGITAPTVPADNAFTTYYGYDGYSDVLTGGGNSELGSQAEVTFEGNLEPAKTNMDVTWTIANTGDAAYDNMPGAENIFRWTVDALQLKDYDATDCPGYDAATGTITGTVTIRNKAATPVTITGTDSSMEYTGETIDANAGTAVYSLVTDAVDGAGEGTLSGNLLTVTKTGTFKIKVNTSANGIYEAGESTIMLTVKNGTIQYEASDYIGTYDGQPHGISVDVAWPAGTDVTYSTDGLNYTSVPPTYTDAGDYTVYYRIEKENCDTITGERRITIRKKEIVVTAGDQTVTWGDDIDRNKYSVSGLIANDSISDITLIPGTTELTDNSTIRVGDVKIVNESGQNVTANYDIVKVNGTLRIIHDETLAPERIEAVKTKTDYTAGDTLNVDDLTVKAFYADNYSEEVTGFTTNAADVDMSQAGDKTLTVSYTKNGVTKTADIAITVKERPVTEHTPVQPVVEAPDITSQPQDATEQTESPRTGDNSNPAFWTLLMLMSMTTLAGLFAQRRKTDRDDESV